MTFDGRYHRSWVLCPPYPGHPHAPSIGDGLSICLEQGYAYGLSAGRICGTQTYRFHEQRRAFYDSSYYFGRTTWVDVARFVKYIPAHATHILFEAIGRIYPVATTTAHQRVVVTDGVDTETGDDFTVEWGARGTQVMGSYDTEDDIDPFGFSTVLARTLGFVDVTGLSLGAELVITVQAYAVESGNASNAATYHPEMYTAWWIAEP